MSLLESTSEATDPIPNDIRMKVPRNSARNSRSRLTGLPVPVPVPVPGAVEALCTVAEGVGLLFHVCRIGKGRQGR